MFEAWTFPAPNIGGPCTFSIVNGSAGSVADDLLFHFTV